MRCIYVYPETVGADAHMLDSGPIGEVAVTAERAGWEGFAFTEHPAPGAKWLASGGHQSLDPFVALGHVAAVTSKMKLLTYLSVVSYRNPLMLAKTAATVDLLSGGRFILGLGTGYLKGEFFSLGADFDERNEMFDEALEVLAMHWSGEPFNFQGKHFTARDIQALPRPVQIPIPIWIGGNAKVTLRRVAEKAQGWMPLISSAEVTTTARTPAVSSNEALANKIRELKDMAGDRAAGLDISVSYTDRSLGDLSKDVERHRDALGQLTAAGATWTVISPEPTPVTKTLEFVQGFAETYLR